MEEEDLKPAIKKLVKKYLEDKLKIEVTARNDNNRIEVKIKLDGREICKDSDSVRYLKTR